MRKLYSYFEQPVLKLNSTNQRWWRPFKAKTVSDQHATFFKIFENTFTKKNISKQKSEVKHLVKNMSRDFTSIYVYSIYSNTIHTAQLYDHMYIYIFFPLYFLRKF